MASFKPSLAPVNACGMDTNEPVLEMCFLIELLHEFMGGLL